MIENKEFQEILKKYPDDAVMALCLEYNNQKSLFYDLEINGIKFEVEGTEIKAVIIVNEDFNKEYETLINGGEIDEKIYRE